ncbi:hypothetical protein STCU_11734 [Strigomonas culicis]|uniref:Uncharacterized protein n=1 Tax=Strigomonas culicis TaxID=28005 RepID=S9UZ45_9TRYP|nr:hypothetical protein STCU_11734 [Strigomonas culicis]|eukprot:EPY15825.1 hypothetical protein STCU_11734 [Strigomonas culicis]
MYTIRCTRRLRDPLQHLILQPTDLSTVQGAVYTRHAVMATFYLPLANLQAVMHRRYEAEQVAELVLPPGVPPPPVRSLTLTEQNLLAGVGDQRSQGRNSERNRKAFAALRDKMGGKHVPPSVAATLEREAAAPSSPFAAPPPSGGRWRRTARSRCTARRPAPPRSRPSRHTTTARRASRT